MASSTLSGISAHINKGGYFFPVQDFPVMPHKEALCFLKLLLKRNAWSDQKGP